MDKIHGHDVIAMIKECSKSFSKEEIITAVHETFGKECRFYNCSNDDMSALELITFFEGKGKITFSENGFSFGTAGGCKH